nr:leucyl/phenylalanyl-tRNA--protein transferase [uncultured bacterium]
MSIYRLPKALWFPPVDEAEDGLLAVGGDLSPERLLLAYRSGIFPWYSRGEPILWWSPDPRAVLFPGEFHCSRSLAKEIRRGGFSVTMDTAFPQVIQSCAKAPRKHEAGTWIVPQMQAAYIQMHELGYAHSIETWREGQLVGGLYGMCLGGMFFGESKFSSTADASKIALAALVAHCPVWGLALIDSQVANPHMLSLGARDITRTEYLCHLARLLEGERPPGKWTVVPGLLENAFGGPATTPEAGTDEEPNP